jgi:hypothetical protein
LAHSDELPDSADDLDRADDGSSASPRLEPDIAPLRDLDRELGRLQRQYRVVSQEVGECDVRPDGIDDATLAWWIAAHRAVWRRRFDPVEPAPARAPVDHVELRKTRLRKPRD